ncbi:MAG: MnhB domain-containing protein [Firmicutes bacterium]|nr:MnhB domain-containing protein [Bacillota bacterium]
MNMDRNKDRKKIVGVFFVIAVVIGVFFLFPDLLPAVDDAKAPVHTYLSDYYIENSLEDTGAHNMVTAVLADYRGFDTLFETCVMFLAGVTALMVLSTTAKVTKPERSRKERLQISFGSTVLDIAFRIIVPVIVIYAFYVLVHGELSLGGGFQAGALLAIAYMIDRIIPSFNSSLGNLKEETAAVIAGVGVFIYILTGLLPMAGSGNFLEYGKLPFGADTAEQIRQLHGTGILLIEIGVVVCVMATIINILEVVLERTEFDD